MYIKNCRDSRNLKHFSTIKLCRKFENKYFEVGNFSYTHRCTQVEKRASRTLGTFGFCRNAKPTLKNQKSLILANARLK